MVGNEERLLGAFFFHLLYWYQRTCFTGTKVLDFGVFCLAGNEEQLLGALCWYQNTCFTGTKVFHLRGYYLVGDEERLMEHFCTSKASTKK